MAKITFITFYNDYSIGVNVLSSILIKEGHDVSTIFFKLPSTATLDWFRKESVMYREAVTAEGDIIGGNAGVNPWTPKETGLLIDTIGTLNPDIICISSRTPDNMLAIELLPKIRDVYDGVLLAGGFGPSIDPEIYVDLADYVFIGEAESVIADLISKIENGISIENMDNICFKKDSRIIKNKLSEPDINQFKTQIIPKKAYYIENDRIYNFEERSEIVKTHTYSTFIGRGCLNACTYCAAGQWFKLYKNEGIFIKQRRLRPLEDLKEELSHIKNTTSCTFIFFRDEFLSAPTKYLMEFFSWYEENITIPFWAYLVPKQILKHPELLEQAVNAGFVDTEIGIQSGSEAINKSIWRRNMPIDETVKYAEMLSEYDINIKYDIIIFNPAETKEDIIEAFRTIQKLPKKRSYLYLPRLVHFPGSPMVDEKILSKYKDGPQEFERYYCTALLYLLCFVMPKKQFDTVLVDKELCESWKKLKLLYKGYLKEIDFKLPIGTHEVASSITTQRYKRIIKRKNYKEVIIWGAGDYYKEMREVFNDTRIKYHIDDTVGGNGYVSPVDVLSDIKEPLPIFVCDKRKQEIKMKILTEYPQYNGKIIV